MDIDIDIAVDIDGVWGASMCVKYNKHKRVKTKMTKFSKTSKNGGKLNEFDSKCSTG